jgi:hypothetical protein
LRYPSPPRIQFGVSSQRLVGAVGFSLHALRPKEHVGLAIEYVRRFPTGSEVLKRPEQVRGETMRTLVETIARGRSTNERKVESIRRSFSLLLVGLLLVAGEGATLGINEVVG